LSGLLWSFGSIGGLLLIMYVRIAWLLYLLCELESLRVDWILTLVVWSDSKYFSSCSLLDGGLVDKDIPGHTCITLLRFHILTLMIGSAVNLVCDVTISLSIDVLWLHWWDITSKSWNLPMRILLHWFSLLSKCSRYVTIHHKVSL
jgi:hypothetical protein